MKIAFVASSAPLAQKTLTQFVKIYGGVPIESADYLVAIGGDGFMLDVLRRDYGLPVYGVNRGTVGFLMNDPDEARLVEVIKGAEIQAMPLLDIRVMSEGRERRATAINDVSLLRASPQAANLRILINEEERMEKLSCDGILVSTPAGSTAYNASLGGPILPVDANVLALTPMAAFRPRRWRGAVLPMNVHICIENLDKAKRPVGVSADGEDLGLADWVEVSMSGRAHTVLFDPGHSLERRILDEQFI